MQGGQDELLSVMTPGGGGADTEGQGTPLSPRPVQTDYDSRPSGGTRDWSGGT